MLTIRQEQLDALADSMRQRLRGRICVLLREHHPGPASVYDDAALSAFVDGAIGHASGWGFTTERAIGDYVALALQLGPSFDQHVAVRRVLGDATVAVDERVAALFTRLSGAEWDSVGAAGKLT